MHDFRMINGVLVDGKFGRRFLAWSYSMNGWDGGFTIEAALLACNNNGGSALC